MNTARIEANEIYGLMPKSYNRGTYYPVQYKGSNIKITLKRSPKGLFLHVLKPCTSILRDPDGNEINRRPDFRHYRIELFNIEAKWHEV